MFFILVSEQIKVLFVLRMSSFFYKNRTFNVFFLDLLMTVFWLKFGMDGKISSRAFQQPFFRNFQSYGCFYLIFQSVLENMVFPGFSNR